MVASRRIIPVIVALALVLSACARSDVFEQSTTGGSTSSGQTPTPITDGPTVARAIDNIQQFWTTNFGVLSTRKAFVPVAANRIFAAKSTDQAGPCDGQFVTYRKAIKDNAFAVDCRREGPMVAYDDQELIPSLRERYGGLGPAIVLAHEWGHVVQFQANINFRSGVYAEQQADCFAGAWFAQAKNVFGELSSKAALDRTIGALLEFRDEPGSDAADRQAHGSGFDRVRAFQEGYERGVSFCAAYVTNPPTLTEFGFQTLAEEANNGNLPYDDLQPALVTSLNLFATTLVPALKTTETVVDAATYKGNCNGTKLKKDSGPVHLCVKELVVVVDTATLRRQEDDFGDGAISVQFALQWAEAIRQASGQKPSDGSIGPLLQQLCVAGGWFRVLLPKNATGDFTLSPGDLDEAIGVMSAAARDGSLGEGELFEAVAAMRQGVLQGVQSCGLGK